jgi:hypothetical protein
MRIDYLPDNSHVQGNWIGCSKSRSWSPFRSELAASTNHHAPAEQEGADSKAAYLCAWRLGNLSATPKQRSDGG